MQLVEGPTLADRIQQSPIPVDEAVRIARQIADALEYAHERGIVHRDLKPANIKIAADDTVKVLDFGLAKALEGDPASIDISTSPTISRMATMQGVLLGTAAYMSPEQAKAKPVDRRADIWAFGCVLYEMLTGKMAFYGEAITDTLAAVIKSEPDWSQVPASTPMRIRVLLQRCLQKDPKQRLRDIGDARISLEEVLSGAPEGAPMRAAALPAWRRALPWAVGVLAIAIAGFAGWNLKPAPTPGRLLRFQFSPPEKSFPSGVAISPDGRELAVVAAEAGGPSRVWVRSFETMEMRPLDGTEGAIETVFWSPDSRFIAFWAQGKLKKIKSSGGPPLTICDATSVLGGDWNRDSQVVFGSVHGVMQVAASGGSPLAITTTGEVGSPSFLPDQRHFLYYRNTGGDQGIYVGTIGTKPDAQAPRPLLPDVSPVAYVPPTDQAAGYVLFVRGGTLAAQVGTLMAQRFDPRRLELTGEAIPIAEQVFAGAFVASTDVLAYVSGAITQPGNVQGGIQGQLTWFDRTGKILGAFGDPGSYRTLALSPDGKRVAFDRADPRNAGIRNIWIYEFGRGVATRFTFNPAWDSDPVGLPTAPKSRSLPIEVAHLICIRRTRT